VKIDRKTALTAARLREVIHYDPETGVFTRRVGVRGQSAGAIAGRVSKSLGYVFIGVDKQTYLAHRLAWLYMRGVWPNAQIDHINGIRDDNRINNLREATIAQNRQNQTGFRRNNSSGYLGVYADRNTGLYTAKIKIGGVQHHIGSYLTAEEAHEAYRQEKTKLHPFGTLEPRTESQPVRAFRLTKTGLRGVQPTKGGRYLAFVTVHGANRSLGAFDTAEEAYAAHQEANQAVLKVGVEAWVKAHDEAELKRAESKRKGASGFAGVELVKSSGKFTARIKKDGKRHYLGQFDSAEEASAAYLKAKEGLYSRKIGGKQP
jgi:hypothetical protein